MAAVDTPAEWHEHAAVWLAWPSHPAEWRDDLEPPRACVAELCRAIADVDAATGQARGEPIEMLVGDEAGEASARAALGDLPVHYHRIPFGDIWLRDTGPRFVMAGGRQVAACFSWNGWGGKYLFEHDAEVAGHIAEAVGIPIVHHDWICEGGAVEIDGAGTAISTQQCLLDQQRNGHMSREEVERALLVSLGIERVLWLDLSSGLSSGQSSGQSAGATGCSLMGDHTDGHVDTLARFVSPDTIVCMRPAGPADPNREALEEVGRALRRFRNARGGAFEVVDIPSPGAIRGPDGAIAPASYVNFYIGNRVVVVPTYGAPSDAAAVEGIGQLFPTRRTVGLDARAILTGGGAFHCITRDQPARRDQPASRTRRTTKEHK